MANETNQQRRGPSDPTDYSSTLAPETQKAAENHHAPGGDDRLWPGGTHGAAVDTGMSSLDRDAHPTGGQGSGEEDFGGTEDVKR